MPKKRQKNPTSIIDSTKASNSHRDSGISYAYPLTINIFIAFSNIIKIYFTWNKNIVRARRKLNIYSKSFFPEN